MNQDKMSCFIAIFIFIIIHIVGQGKNDIGLTKNVEFELHQSFLTL